VRRKPTAPEPSIVILTRRSTLTLALAALAAPALVRPAHAACVRPDLAKGIVFKRQDGSRGLARREGDGTVVIDYVTNRGEWLDRRRVKNGVFEVARIVQESELPIVGASAPDYAWTYSPKIIQPKDGATWNGKIREVMEVTISDERGTVEREKTRWDASYRCFEPREVNLSGCSYQALTVEAVWSGAKGTISQRWVYLPELGLGLETKRNGKGNGIVALTPA
jgi:hypothetical protein